MGYRDGVVPTRGWVDSCRWSFDEATFSFRKQWRGIGIVSNRWRWGFVCVRKRFGLSLGDSNERFRIEPNSRKRESRWWFDFYARNVAEEKIFFYLNWMANRWDYRWEFLQQSSCWVCVGFVEVQAGSTDRNGLIGAKMIRKFGGFYHCFFFFWLELTAFINRL